MGATVTSGRRVIVLIVVVGLLAGGYAVWHHYRAGRDARQWWGVEQAMLVRDAERVEALRLSRLPSPAADQAPAAGEAPAGQSAADQGVLNVDGTVFRIEQSRDASRSSGLLHVREQLLKDNSYDWQADTHGEAHWQYALRFIGSADSVVVLFDVEHSLLRRLEHPQRLSYAPIQNFVQIFLQRQFASEES